MNRPALWCLAGCLLLLIGLSGCEDTRRDDPDQQSITQATPKVATKSLYIYTDTLTGCQYITTFNNDTLFPRLGSDGRPLCGQGVAP